MPPQPLAERIDAARPEIAPHLAAYGASVSSPDWAVSLPTARLLAALCELTAPRRVLDCGTGFSSWVLRTYAGRAGAEVWSVDDNGQWLDTTRHYLGRHALDDARLLLWEEFTAGGAGDFDLIFHDFAQRWQVRAAHLPEVCARLSPEGLLLLDDFHKHRYRLRARRLLHEMGFEIIALRHHTLDGFGRYAALARRGRPEARRCAS